MSDGALNKQTAFFRGIYEFEDPSGTLLAARIPNSGSVDLYSGTVIVVRPNQRAMFLYKGQIAEILNPGTHQIATENLPVLTKLANWRFGFTSPLRCEIWFFSTSVFTARRWGTTQPVLTPMGSLGIIPLRAYGNYSIVVKDPGVFYLKMIGGRTIYDVTDLEDYIQGQFLECLPQALEPIKDVRLLASKQGEVAKRLLASLFSRLSPFGIQIKDVQVLSILPPQEVLQALDEKLAMQVIGNQKEYLLYKAANSLDAINGHNADPMQVMMGLMLGKGLLGADSREKEPSVVPVNSKICAACRTTNPPTGNFCYHCGKDMKS